MGNTLIIGVLVFGLLFGAIGGQKIANLNPFRSKPKVVEKSEGYKTEQFRDRIKGLEYRIEEKYKNQTPSKLESNTIGQKVGNFIDTSLRLIIFVIIGGIVLLFLTGINIFKFISKRLKDLASYRKALKQTVKGVQEAKKKMNGEKEILSNALGNEMDADTKKLIDDVKHEDRMK